jgi:hypothetical protein
MWKLRLPIVRSISRSKLTAAGRWAGGCGRRSMELKQNWPPRILESSLDEEEKTAGIMTPAPSIPTDGAN